MLITGFEGYGGRGLNPAAEIVKALNGTTISGHAIIGAVLPVQYTSLAERLTALVERHKPRAIICVGLWPGEPMIRLERVAANLNDFEIPDNDGALEKGRIEPSGAFCRASTLPLSNIQQRLLEAGIPARMSSSAGNFLCNATMYTTLGLVEGSSPVVPCGFIHVPYLPEQVAELVATVENRRELELHQRADTASMSLKTSLRAIEIAAEVTLADVT